MSDSNSKQQVVEKIQEANNILVTVNSNPTVDELSAALGLTLLINKFDKHATAVFSGEVPPAIDFLEPGKTFEHTVDSLRDFIIALDKEKADHLRYKVDGDVVKIFITPYRTVINDKDLEFSQGDYNVELVMAIGVKDTDDLDKALEAHGRILHDASVVALSIDNENGDLGDVSWHVNEASSYSEVLASLAEDLKEGNKTPLDEQIATAFLTGIVSATNRFSNNKTSSRVMNVAAQLMAAGANQQLIAARLESEQEISSTNAAHQPKSAKKPNKTHKDGSTELSEGALSKLKAQSEQASTDEPADETIADPEPAPAPKKSANDGALVVEHAAHDAEQEPHPQPESQPQPEPQSPVTDENLSPSQLAEQKLTEQLALSTPQAAAIHVPSVEDMRRDLAEAEESIESSAPTTPPIIKPEHKPAPANEEEPSMGGTLNATTEQAAEEKRRDLENDRNHTILTHGGSHSAPAQTPANEPTFSTPFSAATDTGADKDEPATVDIFDYQETPVSAPPKPESTPVAPTPSAEAEHTQQHEPTLAELDAKNRHQEKNDAVAAALEAAPSIDDQQAHIPELPMPPMPDFSTLPPLPGSAPDAQPPVGKLEDILPPAPQVGELDSTKPADRQPAEPSSNDPKQFRIPGQ